MQATSRFPSPSRRRSALVLSVCLGAAGCDDAPVRSADVRSSVEEASRWQDVSGTVPAHLWLAGLDIGGAGRPPTESVERFRVLLAEASAAYVETPRMIANRLVQAKDTIDDTPALAGSTDATLELLLRRLLFRARDGQKLLFGTVVHHYLNLRRQGFGEDASAERVAAEFNAERLKNVR